MLSRYLRFIRELYNLNAGLIKQKMLNRRGMNIRQNTDYSILPKTVHREARCCFVLSTGRCGTGLLTRLLEVSEEIRCEHAPLPELVYFSRLSYESLREDGEKSQLGIDMARYELIRDTFFTNRIYVETNNRITFFAPYLAELYEQSNFIHLVRHPGDFVRSGIRREWYTGRHPHDSGRIVPIDDNIDWDSMNPIEKISWLWNETHQFIEDFKASLKIRNRAMFVKAEDLFSIPRTTVKIYEFLQLEPPLETSIHRIIRHPVHAQRTGDFPKYSEWTSEQKEQLKRYAILSSKYGYDL